MPLHPLRAPASTKLEIRYDAFRIPVQATLVWLDQDGEELSHLTSAVTDASTMRLLVQVIDELDSQLIIR